MCKSHSGLIIYSFSQSCTFPTHAFSPKTYTFAKRQQTTVQTIFFPPNQKCTISHYCLVEMGWAHVT